METKSTLTSVHQIPIPAELRAGKNILSDRNLSGKNIKVFVFNVSYHPTGKTNIP